MWNFVPAVLTVALIVFGMWAGGKVELPTIDMKWGLEKVAEDGTVTVLVDEDELETTTIEGIRSIKCYGSAMALKAKLQKIAGVYGVKVFVKRHTAGILHNPSIVSDVYYTPGYNKCVCVDIRFVLWTLDCYAGMQRIIDELTTSFSCSR